MDEQGAVLVTGIAGFVGFFVARNLLAQGRRVIGIDNLNDYYSPALKRDRLAILQESPGLRFFELDIANLDGLQKAVQAEKVESVIHLAAQAGVRYSLENPSLYAQSNLVGFLNVLEVCRQARCAHLVYASSSSVYGANQRLPFSTKDRADLPVSLYAATKRANELMAQSYSHLFRLPCTGLRFFTVYGPWGRPDMAYFSFARKILGGEPIPVFNHGQMSRDFTYVEDAAEAVSRVLGHVPPPNELSGGAPHRLFNVGSERPVQLGEMIACLEEKLGRTAVKTYLPMQPGDVEATFADVEELYAVIGFRPSTALREGLGAFCDWYRAYPHAAEL